MGARSARRFQIGDAGRLIGVGACGKARVHVGHSKDPSILRVKEGVEHALAAPELELEAGSFAHLQRGATEVTNELVCGKANQLARLGRGLDRGRRRLGCRLLRSSRAGSDEQGEGKD